MALREELRAFAEDAFHRAWTTREGQKVPDTQDLKLANDAVKLDATVLYADLAESTSMVQERRDYFAAEVYKTFLYSAAKVIKAQHGEITAYDGDRVMGVFIGESKNTNAAKSALKINYVVRQIITPALKAKYTKSSFVLKHKVGVDTSELFVARTGIRGSNDLVWVGRAANYAAKMAGLSTAYSSYISADVYNRMKSEAKLGGKDKKNMWTDLGNSQLGVKIYGSTWTWSL